MREFSKCFESIETRSLEETVDLLLTWIIYMSMLSSLFIKRIQIHPKGCNKWHSPSIRAFPRCVVGMLTCFWSQEGPVEWTAAALLTLSRLPWRQHGRARFEAGDDRRCPRDRSQSMWSVHSIKPTEPISHRPLLKRFHLII